MTIGRRDVQTLQHLYNYCAQIRLTKERMHITLQSYMEDFIQQNAISMPLLQIGELVKTALSEEFKQKHSELPWHQMAGMRNRFAHDYDAMDPQIVWNTVERNIPELESFCRQILEAEHYFVAYPPK